MKEPIRVLQVLHILNRGGAEAMIMNLYRKVDRTRMQFDFLVHEPDKGLFEDEITQMGGHIFRVSAFKGYNALSYYRECKRLFRQHPEIKVVHGHLGSCAALYLKAAKECGMFTIAHSHSAGSGSFKIKSLVYDVFSYPTKYVAQQLFGCSTEAGLARYGRAAVGGPKYMNFNNAVDASAYLFNVDNRLVLRNELHISEDTLLIGTVGRVTPPKNPYRILSIFKQIVKDNDNLKCLWVGTGEMEPEIRSSIEKEGLQERIIMTGVRSDIPKVMSALDGMLFPSLWEGLPVSVIEAQAANLPVVLADTISRETQISDLLSWHSLAEDDSVWASDVIRLARKHRGNRTHYSFDMSTTGYDINETVKWLMDFYERKSK